MFVISSYNTERKSYTEIRLYTQMNVQLLLIKKTVSPCTYDFYVKSHNYIRETKLSSESYSRLPYMYGYAVGSSSHLLYKYYVFYSLRMKVEYHLCP